jgi:hypothetical protein
MKHLPTAEITNEPPPRLAQRNGGDVMSAWEDIGQSDDWYTPKYIFDALDCRFDLDVAAPEEGPRYVPCDEWLWHESLQSSWYGFVWMNSPFGGRNSLTPWLDKFFAHGNGIALTPDRTSAPWFQRFSRLASSLLFLSPKVKFERPDGSIGKIPGCGTVLMSAGQKGTAALCNARHLGLLTVPQP